jgi:hypothetical protein
MVEADLPTPPTPTNTTLSSPMFVVDVSIYLKPLFRCYDLGRELKMERRRWSAVMRLRSLSAAKKKESHRPSRHKWLAMLGSAAMVVLLEISISEAR